MRQWCFPLKAPIAACALLSFLTACGTATSPTTPTSALLYPYLTTVKVTKADTQTALEEKYGGSVRVYHPESGFAIIATSTKPTADVNLQGVSDNLDTWSLPEATPESMLQGVITTPGGTGSWASGVNSWANGATSWAGGATSWAGGVSAWAGGAGAWAAGSTAWAGGAGTWAGGSSVPPLPGANKTNWLMVGLPQAHLTSKNFGTGVKVAVIDTGVDTNHTALVGRLTPSTDWKDFVDNDLDPQDVAGGNFYGHGTAVAGIITQIVPNAKIMPLRVLSSFGIGNTDTVIQAIDHAIAKGAQIINLSLGANQWDAALENMVIFARSKNIFVVASAGNNGQIGGTEYPARYSYSAGNTDTYGFVLGVGSVKADESISSFSARDGGLSVFAPGEGILSLYPGNRVATFTGTSFAAPVVAGALALAYGEVAPANRLTVGNRVIYSTDYDVLTGKFYAQGQTWYHSEGVLNLERMLYTLPGWTPSTTMRNINLLPNGSFENANLQNWTTSGGSYLMLGAAMHGTWALNMPLGSSAVTRTVTGLQSNTVYSLVASVKQSIGGTGRWTCLKFGSGTTVGTERACAWNSGSDRLTTQFNTGGSTSLTFRIEASPGATGSVYLDDVLLFKSNQ